MNNMVTAGIVSAKGRQIGAGIRRLHPDRREHQLGNSGGRCSTCRASRRHQHRDQRVRQGIAYAVPIDP
jgi:hypothetical protein